uniref:Cubilin n=1 Tax=Pavo cristatus TaxID=9049 RepID=A0A8C9LFB5_PAVCR
DNGGCSTAPMVQCINTIGSFRCGVCPPGRMPLCSCASGYTGSGYGPNGCSPLTDICQLQNPCANGQCLVMTSGYFCLCNAGWTGSNCTENIDECISNPCQNGGICIDGVSGYTCECTSAWTGPQCQTAQQGTSGTFSAVEMGARLQLVNVSCGGYLSGSRGTFSYPNNPSSQRYDTGVSCAWVIQTAPNPSCGGNYTDSEGVITSPFWPNPFINSRQCIYIIRQPEDEKIYLNFTHLELESHAGCSLTFILLTVIFDRYCMMGLSKTFITTTDSWCLLAACGGFLSGEGTIHSPYYPRMSSQPKTCEWIISQPASKVVILNFIDFDIRNTTSCDSDYVEVKNITHGNNTESPLLGKYCGTAVPSRVQSTRNNLYIKFRASSLTNLGFRAQYWPLDTVCGESLTGSEGTITSPGFPDVYPHGINCTWTINIQPGYLIRLTFTSFNLPFDDSCRMDYLEIYDNSTITATQFGLFFCCRYCGRSIPPSLTSGGNVMMLYFVTDHSISSEGFSANYISLDASKVCSHNYNTDTGVLTSPNYPDNYPVQTECIYTITVGINRQIVLRFTNFTLEGNLRCTEDYIEIRDGGYETSPYLGKYCGTGLPPVIISHGNKLRIKFVSDIFGTRKGFSAEWDGTSAGCGGTLTTSSGIFMSPDYPMPYYHSSECYWLLRGSRGTPFEIQFEQFHLEYHPKCNFDYLAVYDGNSSNAKQLGKFCGNQIPQLISSSGDSVYIKLRTDSSVHGGGFLANYKQVCHEVLTVNRSYGVLESLNYPNNYPLREHCRWTIQATKGNTLSYSFTAFDVEDGSNCNHDYLKLYDGPDVQSNLIGTFCGQSLPLAGNTTGTSLHVEFYSDGLQARSGFQMLWHINGKLTRLPLQKCFLPHMGRRVPAYAAPLPANKAWSANISPDNKMAIYIYAKRRVFGGPDFLSPRLAQLCISRSAQNPLLVSTTGNSAVVRFKTDEAVTGKGFSASWQENLHGCGCIFQATSGEIHSPNYPEPYSNNTDCSWLIQVDYSHRVLLNFTDFDIENHRLCNYDNVTVSNNRNFKSFLNESEEILAKEEAYSCGSFIESDSVGAAISSPLYPAKYPNNQNCSWIIQAQEPFNHITLSFTDFDIENNSQNCTADFVEILDGNNYDAPLQGRYCGTTMPHPITSFGNALVVNFISNNNITARGFRATYAASSSSCGGTFHMDRGAFNSPGYPEPYPLNTECVWTILSSPGNRLQLSFISGFQCLKKSFLVSTHPIIVRPFFLAQEDAYIFVFLYIIGACGGTVTSEETPSFLYSPGWPLNYRNFADCVWLIRAPGSTVEFNILALDIESHSSCYYDRLTIQDGDDGLSPLLATICGREPPGPVRSTGETMFIRFVSDASVTGAGFNASYHKSCGGYLHADRGVITSPSYPQDYTPNLNCSWHVLVTSGFIITVHFEQPFQVKSEDASCNSGDYVELKNGLDASAPPLGSGRGNGRFCGSSPISTMYTTDNQLFVHFISDSRNEGQGFKLKYEAKSLACGGNIYINDFNPSGYTSSPNYPNNYPSHADCVWTITAPNGHAVELQFEDQFYIEPSPNCTSSYLELRNGADSSAPVLAKLCGSLLPGSQRSSGAVMYLRFRSDSSDTHVGFNAKYSIAPCGGIVAGQTGIIESVGYPDLHYPDNLLCEWFLQGPRGHYLTITLEDLDIQNSSECANDFMEIREYNASGNLLGRYCGNTLPDAVDTSDSFAYVKFVADGSINARGFRLRFDSSTEECGGDFSAPVGMFTSPNYPNLYPHNRVCEWRITVEEGRRIILTINDMRTEEHWRCSSDYVAVYNGLRKNSPRLVKLCGEVNPGTEVKSSGNTMKVVLVTDMSHATRGFSVSYTSNEDSVCGGTLMGYTGGNFSSPGYDGVKNYTSKLNCEWTIENPSHYNSSIYISFEDFHLEHHQDCQYDYLELRIGDADGELIARLCGQAAPSVPLVIAAPQVWIHFVSDENTEDRGFLNRCARMVTGPDWNCANSPPVLGSELCFCLLQLSFTAFHVENHPLCNWDSVTILNGGSPGSPVIGRYCGNTSPGIIQSGSNKLLVIFNSDHSIQGGGFYATWTAESLGCGGIIHSDSGMIKSPHWPQNFPMNTRCTWTIITHESKHLEMIFHNNFQIPYSDGSCQSSFVKVWQGNHEDVEALLATGCGTLAPDPVIAPNNIITTVFQSRDAPGQGFSASFTSRCGINFTSPAGRIVSPNYPSQYDNNLNCSYIIDRGPQSLVILEFETFHLEGNWFFVMYVCIYHEVQRQSLGSVTSPAHSVLDYHNNMNCSYYITVGSGKAVVLKFNTFQLEISPSCYKDYVAVYDGSDTHAPLLGKFCGSELPPNIKSSSNQLFLVFNTDFSGSDRGWKASFRETLGPQDGCGGYLTYSAYSFGSPVSNVSGRYERNLDCVWVITAPVNKLINLTFTSFVLEAHVARTCQYDYVKLYDGGNENANLVGTFCGSTVPAPFLSTSNSLTVKFITDNSVQREGFNVTYTTVDRLCGGTYNATSTSLIATSPNFPNEYPPFTLCTWVIDAPPQQQVKVVVETFHLHSSQDCSQNYLQLQDLPVVRNLQSIPCPICIQLSSLFVKRRKTHCLVIDDDSCQGYIHNIKHYAPLILISWKNGSNMQSPLLGRFCGNTVPSPIFPQNHVVFLRFKSDISGVHDGYEITWTSSSSGCGGTLYGSTGTFASPRYPATYRNNTDCEWAITVPKGRTVTVNFDFISIDDPGDCSSNYLILYNGPDTSYPQAGPYCGMDTNIAPFTATSHQVYVKFHAEYVTSPSGFRLSWMS